MAESDKPTALYFVQANTMGLIKIGIARDPTKRLCDLQVGSPDALSLLGVAYPDNAREIERECHAVFKPIHSHGEWFHPHPDLLEYISSVAEQLPPKKPWRIADKIMANVAARKAREAEAATAHATPKRPPREKRPPKPQGNRAILAAYKAARGL